MEWASSGGDWRWRWGAGALLGASTSAWAETVLRVGDQIAGNRSVMEAAGVLADVPYRIRWLQFPAAAPLLEALNAGALDVGFTGDVPFLLSTPRACRCG